jgi:competence protein ComEC
MQIFYIFIGILYFYSKSPLIFLSFSFLVINPKKFLLYISCLMLGMMISYGHNYLLKNKHQSLQGRTFTKATVVAKIIAEPRVRNGHLELQVAIQQLNQRDFFTTAILSCYRNCPNNAKINDIWRFIIKLKEIHNLNNPGSFDYKTWCAAKHIDAVGNIYSGSLIKNSSNFLSTVKPQILAKIRTENLSPKTVSILEALSLGITDNITTELWDLFRRTGTVHIMVISGAHIGLVAGLIFTLVKNILGFIPKLNLIAPAQRIASLFAIVAAAGYAGLSGFGSPAARAFFALILVLLRNLGGIYFSTWQIWRISLLCVLLIEPHAVLLSGFYLSFLAVAILLATNQRFFYLQRYKIFMLQLACLIGLMPFTLYWFAYGSINGLLANLISVPLVGFLLVPLSLSIALLPSNIYLSYIFDYLAQLLLSYLRFIDQCSFINLQYSLPYIMMPISIIIVLVLFLYLPIKKLYPAYCCLILLNFLPYQPQVPEKNIALSVLDVGQGLAVILYTRHHTIVYDTGIKFTHGSMATRVIEPYLNYLGRKTLDFVIISHLDLDHSGGLNDLSSYYHNFTLLVDSPQDYSPALQPKSCHTYPAFILDGVEFEFLPAKKIYNSRNNNSCVLKVNAANTSILLTGDIEKSREAELVKNYAAKIPANILLVPHHGSKTSSSEKFLVAVKPQHSIISSGFDNRYHLPNKFVLSRLKNHNLKIYNTVDYGMITLKTLE